ncbi:MAG: hypothetical protein J2P41_16965, partial [Blastocatellia bacterium]|nr:hypothetical protein [Blastocatellia bacterium]
SSFQIAYTDPDLRVVEEPAPLKLVEKVSAKSAVASKHAASTAASADRALPQASPPPAKRPTPEFSSDRIVRALVTPWKMLFMRQLWAHPGRVTAFIVTLVAVILLVHGLLAPSINAASILARANSTEETINGDPSFVQHRILEYEVRHPLDGKVISRWRIEDYRSGARGIKVRRLYDEKNSLIAGEWRKADGTRTLYGRDGLSRVSSRLSDQSLNLDDMWQIDLSAKDFAALIKHPNAATMEETARTYVIKYQPVAPAPTQAMAQLISATITLSKHGLYPVEQVLVVSQASETREVHLKERSNERIPAGHVAPDKFEPEPELVGSNGTTREAAAGTVAPAMTAAPPAAEPSPAVMATDELKVEVIRLLDQVNAFSRDQLTVSRTSQGYLEVEGIVDSEERKVELQNSLASVANNPAVKIRIETIAEAQRRIAARKPSAAAKQTETGVSFMGKLPLAYPDLQHYFSERGMANEKIPDATDKFADGELKRSSRILLQARAMKQISTSFTAEQLNALDERGIGQWRTLIRNKAQNIQNELTMMRRDLEPIFLSPNLVNETAAAPAELTSNADLVNAVGRLFDLSVAIDKDIRGAFSISTAGPAGDQATPATMNIKQPQFWRSLKNSENISAAIKNSFPTSHR